MNIGIFGGSFNPIHIGHAILTNFIVQNTDIDKVWLMVSRQNPLKSDFDKSYDLHRLRMITSGLEFTLPYPSYTINTLDTLADKFPDDNFKVIIGADNWAVFDKWKDYKRIIMEYGVMIYPRIGFDIVIPEEFSAKVTAIDAPIVEISSTFIRAQIADNKDLSFFLPDDVQRYITRHNLYK